MRSVRARGAVTVFLLLAAFAAANGESLWSTDFRGYLSGSRGLAVGQSLVVQIDASSSLSFSSSSNDSKNLTLEFTGGQSGNLFSFLPQVRTGGTLTTAGKDSLSLKTQVPVVVTALNPDGSAQVQGTRTVAIQGKNESITITGTIPPGQAGSINFSQLANARLTYTTFLASAANVLSPADLQTILAPAAATAPAPATAPAAATAAGGTAAAAAPAVTAGGAAAPAGVPAATAAAATPAAQPGLTISDARKRQLLLLYLNRLIDVVFSQ